ncbi:hypothetical protein [Streptomyces sp. NPDC005549]
MTRPPSALTDDRADLAVRCLRRLLGGMDPPEDEDDALQSAP